MDDLKHMKEILTSLFGEDFLKNPHTVNTPVRILNYWLTLVPQPIGELELEFTTFPNVDPRIKQLVAVNRIAFHSACAHHFLPFEGHVYIGYKPDDLVAGLSKFPRAVKYFAQRPQTQEIMGRNLADWLDEKLHPTALILVIDAVHTCTTCRGVEAAGTVMTTSVVLGDAQRYDTVKTEFFEMIRPWRHT